MAIVLVAAGEEILRDMIADSLAQHGFRVACARSNDQARELLGMLVINLLILDDSLIETAGIPVQAPVPTVGGYALAVLALIDAVRSKDPRQPPGWPGSVDAAFIKPITPDDLLRIVGELLGPPTGSPTRPIVFG